MRGYTLADPGAGAAKTGLRETRDEGAAALERGRRGHGRIPNPERLQPRKFALPQSYRMTGATVHVHDCALSGARTPSSCSLEGLHTQSHSVL